VSDASVPREGEHEAFAAEFQVQSSESVDPSLQQQAVLRLRAVPASSGTTALRAPGDTQELDAHSAPVAFVASRDDLGYLTTDLLRKDRGYPVVVLTLGDCVEESFPPEAVRALDPSVPIYLIGNSSLCRRLVDVLGTQLAVEGGDARIFWTGAGEGSDATDHPLVPLHSANDPRDAAERLVTTFELSRPFVRRYLASIHERLAASETQVAGYLAEHRERQAKRGAAPDWARAAESQLVALEQQLHTLKAAVLPDGMVESDAGTNDSIAEFGPYPISGRISNCPGHRREDQ
jgi:hypothetical protein